MDMFSAYLLLVIVVIVVIVLVLFAWMLIHIALPGGGSNYVLFGDEALECLQVIQEFLFLFFVKEGYLQELLVEERNEDGVDRGKVGLVDECGTLVGLEVGTRASEAVVLLFELVNMAFEDVVARTRVSDEATTKAAGDDERDILVPPVRDGVELEG